MKAILIISAVLTNTFLFAQTTYNWTGFTTTTNSSTANFTNGNMSATVTGVTGGGQTAYSAGNTTVTGGTGECAGNPTGLYLEMSGASSAWNNSITVTITFATAVCGPVTFSIYEINYNIWNDGTDDWALFYDKVSIGATDQTATAIAPANIVIGGCAGAGNVSTSGNNKVISAGVFPSDACECSNATVSIGTGQQVKTITIVYNNTNPPPAPIDGKYGICQWQYTIISPIVVNGPPALTITPSIPSCGSTAATLTASNGYTSYAWTTSAPGTIASPGSQSTGVNGYSTYTVTGTTAGCTQTASYTLTNAIASALPTIGTLTGGTIYCGGGTASVSTNATGVNYSWTGPGITAGSTSATATVNTAGTYTLTTTNPLNGCTNSGTVNVATGTIPTVTISMTCGGSGCTRFNFTSSPALSGVTYQWQQSTSASSANPPTGFTNLASGTFSSASLTGASSNLCGIPNLANKWVRLMVTFPGCPAVYSSTSIFASWTSPVCGQIVLPVELLEFTGKCSKEELKFRWMTASETNNDYFTIEKSKNGFDFYPIAIVDGAGTSSAVNEYEKRLSNDENDFNYYRLMQTDFNGESSYSQIITLDCSNHTNWDEISIYPNPANEQLTIDFGNAKPDELEFFIVDITGRLIQSEWIPGYENKKMLDLSSYANGIYFLNFSSKESDSGMKSIKFIKTSGD